MALVLPSPTEATAILRALATVARVDGPLSDRESAMLEAGREVAGVGPVPLHDPISPEALAAALPTLALRQQALSAMVVMSMLDGAPDDADAASISRFAAALDTTSDELESLRQLVDGDLWRFKLDLARRVWLVEHLKAAWAQGGLRWLGRALGTKLGLSEDAALAERYRALGSLPEGTVGRTYHDSLRADGFPLPGEKGSQVEPVVIHDLMHLLSGYGTDPEGEILTASFCAGNRGQHPFTFVFFVVCQFHLGLIKAPFSTSATGRYDPAASLRAVKRGMAVNQDLSSGWDPWSIMHLTVEQARASLGVPPA